MVIGAANRNGIDVMTTAPADVIELRRRRSSTVLPSSASQHDPVPTRKRDATPRGNERAEGVPHSGCH